MSATLEARVARLERWNRILALLLVLGAGTGWVLSRGQEAALTTSRLEVVDAEGRARWTLDATEAEPALELRDDLGRVRAVLAHGDEGTALYLKDAEGTTRVGVAQFAHGGGGFALHGPQAKGAAALYLRGDGSLTFYGPEGEVQARFPPGG